MGLGELGVESQGVLIARRRFVDFIFAFENASQVVPGAGKIGIKPQGLAVVTHRFVKIVLTVKGIAEIAGGLGKRGTDAQGFLKAADRFIHLAQAKQSVAKIVAALRGNRDGRPGLSCHGSRLRPKDPCDAERCTGCCLPRHRQGAGARAWR